MYLNGSGKSYSYDYKGNVTADQSNNITSITYDHRNLPLSITSGSGTSRYRYNDHGDRIYKETAAGGREYYLRDDKGREVAVYDLACDKLSAIGGNGLVSGIETGAKNAIDGKDITKNVVTNLTVGAVGEAAGKVVTKVAQGTAKGRALAHDAKRAQNIADAGKKRISQTIKADKAKDKFDNHGAGNTANTAKAVVQGLIQKWLGN